MNGLGHPSANHNDGILTQGRCESMHAKFFISYFSEDKNKLEALSRALKNSSKKFEPIIIAKTKIPGKPLTDKVEEGILETPYFIPILTRSSITSQWVNQEIGFAIATHRNIIPIVELSCVSKLKGFIHSQVDLPFTFKGDRYRKRKEAKNFRKCYKELILHLEAIMPFFKSSISPKKLKQGDLYTTKVHFKGTVKNAFFDNEVQHLDSNWKIWNWDPRTLRNGRPTTPGELHGQVDQKSQYTHETSGWPIGKYRIYTRVYEHPIPGKASRYIISENKHNFEVT